MHVNLQQHREGNIVSELCEDDRQTPTIIGRNQRGRSAEVGRSQHIMSDRDTWSRAWSRVQLPVELVLRNGGGEERGAPGLMSEPEPMRRPGRRRGEVIDELVLELRESTQPSERHSK